MLDDELTRSDDMQTRLETLTVRLPKEVVDLLDSLVERKLFSNRSEAIREFCRDYVQEGR